MAYHLDEEDRAKASRRWRSWRALGTEFYTKYVIVVDDDVDIFDMNDVMWAVATRVRAEKDIVLHPGRQGRDPRSHLRPRDLYA